MLEKLMFSEWIPREQSMKGKPNYVVYDTLTLKEATKLNYIHIIIKLL